MVKPSYLKMVTDSDAADLISNDLRELGNAAKKLATHAVQLGASGFPAAFLQWLASFAAMYVFPSLFMLLFLFLPGICLIVEFHDVIFLVGFFVGEVDLAILICGIVCVL